MPAPCGERLEDFVTDLKACGELHAEPERAKALLEPWRERLEIALRAFNVNEHWSWDAYRRELVRRIEWWFEDEWRVMTRPGAP